MRPTPCMSMPLPIFQMDFNVKLKFDYTNAWGTEIYHDPMQRHVYKTGKCLMPFEKLSWVNYQGEMYIKEDGARYEVTKHPHKVDAFGMLHAPTINSLDISF